VVGVAPGPGVTYSGWDVAHLKKTGRLVREPRPMVPPPSAPDGPDEPTDQQLELQL
jgi:hypothetical protein